MLCAPPAGCGKGFCFECLQLHEDHDPAKCKLGQMGNMMMQAHNPERVAKMMAEMARRQQGGGEEAAGERRVAAGSAGGTVAATGWQLPWQPWVAL